MKESSNDTKPMVLPAKAGAALNTQLSIEPALPVWEESTSVGSPFALDDLKKDFLPNEPSWFALALVFIGLLARYLRKV